MKNNTPKILLWAALALCAGSAFFYLRAGTIQPAAGCLFGAVAALYVAALLQQRALECTREELKTARDDEKEQQMLREREREEAQAATRAQMEEFRSLISHEIRMPISIIQGYADMLANGIVDDEDKKREYLLKISEHTHLISDALSQQLRTIEDKRNTIAVRQRIDAVDLLQQAAADMKTVASDSGITIQTLSSQPEIPMDADRFRLNKALFNIIENSCKYMGRPGLITLRADCGEDWVSLDVKDDGLGLPAEEAAHIFERSYQGSNAAGGHGHGLFLVREAAVAHNGTVEAHSAPGMGMDIKIMLPRWLPSEEKTDGNR